MKKLKQLLALLLAIFLISLYVATLVVSCIDSPYQGSMLKACIFSTVVIPIFLWAYGLIYRVLKNKNQQNIQEDEKLNDHTISAIAHKTTKEQPDKANK